MNSDKNHPKKYPDGWVLCKSKSNPGRKYYFNKRTGKSSWTEPQAEEKSGHCKHKKRKSSQSERNKKEEKSLKRKSDSKDGIPNKKQKEEHPTPEKHDKTATPKKPSPAKPHSSNKKESPAKTESQKTTPKNAANNRLSQLRQQLSHDAQKEETASTDKSPPKVKQRISPSATHTETHAKTTKTESKSPNEIETKGSNSQSPNSDSHQSSQSPSQFFAANKILSSMKAQLPEEYCNKQKQKDTFADIEQGICNQTADYPFMKHPATPPQFSEASKLVSAIKSKLSYKVTNKDTPVKSFSTAKDRMEALRSRLSSEAENTSIDNVGEKRDVPCVNKDLSFDVKDIPYPNDESYVSKDVSYASNVSYASRDVSYASKDISYASTDVSYDSKDVSYCSNDVSYAGESMEVDEVNANVPLVQCTKENVGSNKDVVLVVDTNIFIHELDFIKNVLNSHIKGYSEQPTLLVPWRVINELDRLKDNNNGNGAICKRAKSAMDYLYKSLPENNRIKGQSLRDANSHIYPCEIPDDEILNCCLQQSERGKAVILLSNDKNLCNKAVINGVRCVGLAELRPLLTRPRAAPAPPARCRQLQGTVYQLLANILENEMRAKYNNLWQHVIFKAPPWSLSDVLQCLLKHWIAVFNEVFPRIEHLITDLSKTLSSIESKDPSTLSESEVSNFKELCLEVARKCQIIPEYMELAKLTVERLTRKGASETDAEDRDGEMCVIEAFEWLWTVFSSYCAKLSTGLGISHDLEDKIPCEDSPVVLMGKCRDFSDHTNAFTDALGLLCASSPAEGAARVAAAWRGCGALAPAALPAPRPAPAPHQLGHLAATRRNMLQEAYAKFSQLSKLLELCKSKIACE